MISFAALIGITLIIVRGTIFAPLQKLWPVFFRCSQCVGWWIGVAAGASGAVPIYGRLLDAVVLGGAASLFSLLSDAVLLRLLGDSDEA